MEDGLSRIETLIVSQRGLVTIEQLRGARIDDDRRYRLVKKKVLRRLRPSVYGIVGAPDTWERGLLALVLSTEHAVASHASAARLWSFAVRPEDRYEITVPRSGPTRLPAGIVHRSDTLHDEDVRRRDGIPCTSFERTLCDCSALLSPSQLGRVLDDGLRRNVASLDRLKRCAERLESAPGRHMSGVRWLLAERGRGFHPGGSRSELLVLEVIREAGLPLPVQQLEIKVSGKTYRPDFAWPEAKVFAEFYGVAFHSGASAVVADNRRLTDLSAAGWLPLVFTYASTEQEIVAATRAALRQRGVGVLDRA